MIRKWLLLCLIVFIYAGCSSEDSEKKSSSSLTLKSFDIQPRSIALGDSFKVDWNTGYSGLYTFIFYLNTKDSSDSSATIALSRNCNLVGGCTEKGNETCLFEAGGIDDHYIVVNCGEEYSRNLDLETTGNIFGIGEVCDGLGENCDTKTIELTIE